MKLSDLIKELQEDLKESGDVYIYESKVIDENQHTGHSMYSLHRKTRNGNKAKMTFKEFTAWVKEQREKLNTDKYCDCVSVVNGPEEDCPRCDGTGDDTK